MCFSAIDLFINSNDFENIYIEPNKPDVKIIELYILLFYNYIFTLFFVPTAISVSRISVSRISVLQIFIDVIITVIIAVSIITTINVSTQFGDGGDTSKFNKNIKNIYMTKATNKTRKIRGGMSGIDVKGEQIDAAHFFIEHSTIEYLSKGSNGFTFVATLNASDVDNSPYTSTDAETYGHPVSKILLKLIFVNKPKAAESEHIFFTGDSDNLLKLALATQPAFNHEVNIQKEVYTKTMDYLEPICPAIVFSNIYKDKTAKSDILTSIRNHTVPGGKTRAILDSIVVKKSEFNLGLIVMEFADGYMMQYDLEDLPMDDPKKINSMWFDCIFKYLLLELALKTGYHHADFHTSNLLIKPEDTRNPNPYRYFDIRTQLGKPLLIDFGLSVKIKEPKLQEIQEKCAKKDYLGALEVLCTIPRKDGSKINKGWENYYGWVCNIKKYRTSEYVYDRYNKSLDMMFSAREKAKELLQEEFNKTHPDGPHLPLVVVSSKNAVKEDILSESLGKTHKSTVKQLDTTTSSMVVDEPVPELIDISKSPKILKRGKPKYTQRHSSHSNTSSYGKITSSLY